jgi:RNA polymerase sigma-32 factor
MSNTSVLSLSHGMPMPIGNTGSLEAYLHTINQIPLLSFEEEQSLAARYQTQQDLEAARQLVLSHLRFVARIAKNYMGYGLPLGDLIQEGNIGLMKAVKRFDPKVGVRLVTFAVHWIKAEIHEFIIRNWRIVKIATTKAQRKLFFNLRSAKKRLGWFTKQEVEDVARDLNVKPEEVLHMEARLNASDLSFDPLSDDDDEDYLKPSNQIVDRRYDPARVVEMDSMSGNHREKLHHAIETLDERSRDILESRWLREENKLTLHDLAAKYKVSAERVRQLEVNAMKKLKAALV